MLYVPLTGYAEQPLVLQRTFQDNSVLNEWSIAETAAGELKVEDDALIVRNTANNDGLGFTITTLSSSFFERKLYEDSNNKTMANANALVGKVRLEIDFLHNVIPITSDPSRFHLELGYSPDGAAFSAMAEYRFVHPGEHYRIIQVTDNYSILSDYLPYENLYTLTSEIDMNTNTIRAKINDLDYCQPYSFKSGVSISALNAIRLLSHTRNSTESYLKIKELRVYQVEEDPEETALAQALAQLPEKLANDVNNVTEDIILPSQASNGVDINWSTSNSAIISAGGVVTRSVADLDVVLTAVVSNSTGTLKYTKSYSMTVSRDENIPEIPDEFIEQKLLYEETYTSMNNLKNWTFFDDDHTEISIQDGALVFNAVKSTPFLAGDANNSAWSFHAVKNLEGIISSCAENGTEIIANEFSGIYALEFDMETKSSTQRPIATRYEFDVGYADKASRGSRNISEIFADLRFLSNGNLNVYHEVEGGSKVTFYNSPCPQMERFKARFVFNTKGKTFDMYINNILVRENTPMIYGTCNNNMLSAFKIMGMQAADIGSYLKIYGIKLYQIEPDLTDRRFTNAISVFNSLPDSITSDHLNVTENITLPNVSSLNANWKTSNSYFITNDGVINRWVDDAQVYLDAEFESVYTAFPPFNYSKRYHLNVKSDDEAQTKELSRDIYEEGSTLKNWSFGSLTQSVSGSHSVTENGLEFKKTMLSDEGIDYDIRSYYGIKHFKAPFQYDNVLTDGLYGVYDCEFSITPDFSGNRPVMAELGYYDVEKDIFINFGALHFTQNDISLVTDVSIELERKQNLISYQSGNKINVKLRVDTRLSKIWVYINDILMTDTNGVTYYNSQNVSILNSMRVALDQNMPYGSLVTINNIVLTQKLASEIQGLSDACSLINELNASVITDTPENMTEIKSLPLKIGNKDITWSVDNESMVNIKEGKVFRIDSDVDVTFTARIKMESSGVAYNVYKNFTVTILASNDPADYLLYLANKLSYEDITAQDPNDIRYDLSLIESIEGYDIAWTSNKPAIIDNNGKLNRNRLIKNQESVRITASISDASGNTAQKTFDLKMKGRGNAVTLYNEQINATVKDVPFTFTLNETENCKITKDSYIEITLSKTNPVDGELYIKDSKGNKGLILSVYGNSIKFGFEELINLSDNTDATIKIYIMPDKSKAAIWVNNSLVLDNVSMLRNITDLYSVSSNTNAVTIKNVSLELDEYGAIQASLDNIDYSTAFGDRYIRDDISLNYQTVGGASIEWISGRPDIVSNEGVLTIPNAHEFFDMTVKIISDEDNGLYVSKGFSITVPCDADKNIANNQKFTSTGFESLVHPISNINDKNPHTYFYASKVGNRQISINAEFDGKTAVNTFYLNEMEHKILTYSLEYSLDGTTFRTLKSGSITDNRSRLIIFETIAPKFIRFNVLSLDGNAVKINEMEFYLFADEEEITKIDVNYTTIEETFVTKNLNFSAEGAYGTPLVWSTSDESVITSSGIYIQPQYDTQVTITVSATYDGKTFSKNFVVIAQGKNGAKGPSVVGGGSTGGGGGGTNSLPALPQSVPTGESGTIVSSDIFHDVSQDMWSYMYIKELKDKNIVEGDGDGNFSPDSSVTREQFLKMLILAANIKLAGNENPFIDVDSSQWYADYVLTAKETGIANGISNVHFGIGENIIRQDMAVMIANCFKHLGIETEISVDIFYDDAKIDNYAKDAVYRLRMSNIVKGYENNFSPKDNLTRAEAATVIYGLMQFI